MEPETAFLCIQLFIPYMTSEHQTEENGQKENPIITCANCEGNLRAAQLETSRCHSHKLTAAANKVGHFHVYNWQEQMRI